MWGHILFDWMIRDMVDFGKGINVIAPLLLQTSSYEEKDVACIHAHVL